MKKILLALLLPLLVSACATDLVGDKGDLEHVEYPAGMVLHPNGRYAYVVGTNFNLDYRATDGGILHVVDLENSKVLPGSKRMGSFGTNVLLSDDARRGYALTRSDNSLVWFEISEDGRDISCPLAKEGSESLLDCRVMVDHDPTHFSLKSSYRESIEIAADGTKTPRRVDFDLIMIAQLRNSSVTALTAQKLADGSMSFSFKTASLVLSASEVLWHSGEDFFVTGRAASDLAVISPAINAAGEVQGLYLRYRLTMPQAYSAYEGRGMALDPSKRQMYLISQFPKALYKYNVGGLLGGEASGESLGVSQMISLPADMSKIAWIGDQQTGAIYMSSVTEDALYIVDPSSFEIVSKISVGDGPYEFHVDAANHALYILHFLSSDIWKLDTSNPLAPKVLTTYLTSTAASESTADKSQ